MTFIHDRRPLPSAQGSAAPAFRLSVLATLVWGLSVGLIGTSVRADELLAFVEQRPGATRAAVPAPAPRARTQVVSLAPETRAAVPEPRARTQVVSLAPETRAAVPEPRARTQVVSLAPETRAAVPAPRARTQVVSLAPETRAAVPEPRARVQVVSWQAETRTPAAAPAPAPAPAPASVTFERVPTPVTVTAYTPPARPLASRSEALTFSKVDANTVAVPATRVQVSAPSPAAAPASRNSELPGVSALAALGVSESVALRQVTAVGPSERELREIFSRAVQAAAERSPKVQAAVAEQSAADADIDEAKGQRWPQVDVSTTGASKKFGSGANESSGAGIGVNLNVVTPLYDWGRIRSTIESRRHLSAAAASAIEAELENSAFDVTHRIVELGKQRIIVDLSQQYVDRMNELVKMLAGIVAVDKGRSSELTQAKSRMLQAQAARDSADTRARDAEINLRKLVGDRPIAIPRTPQWNIRLANLDALLNKVDDHPLLNRAKEQTQSAELQAKVVRASSLPQLNWVVNKSTADDSLGREQPWETHLALSWGAFRGGSTRASERAALQRAEAGRQQAEQQRLDLEYGIRTANHEAKTFLERAELYRSLTTESDGIRVAFYEQWYHLGKRTLLDVLSAESDHYGNRVSEITNRFDGYQAILRQYAGSGTLGTWLQGDGR